MCVYIYIYIYTCIAFSPSLYTYIYIYIYTYMYVCMYVCMYIYIYIYIYVGQKRSSERGKFRATGVRAYMTTGHRLSFCKKSYGSAPCPVVKSPYLRTSDNWGQH